LQEVINFIFLSVKFVLKIAPNVLGLAVSGVLNARLCPRCKNNNSTRTKKIIHHQPLQQALVNSSFLFVCCCPIPKSLKIVSVFFKYGVK